MTSTIESSFFLALSAVCSEPRKPVTTTTVSSPPEAAGAFCAKAGAAKPPARIQSTRRDAKRHADTVNFRRTTGVG
jgi:hypothetical protein